MFLSSSELMVGLINVAAAEHGAEDVVASSSERDEGSIMSFALGDFAVVVGA